jgi:hypothetical protein
MIEFIEKERCYDDSWFTGQCWMYPVFMLKDGKEYFVQNRREPDDSWKQKELEGRKAELIANDGAYFRFNGFYPDPLKMLAEMEEQGHTFTEPDSLFVDCQNSKSYGEGFVDFHGNRKEVSAAFHYRIYDLDLLKAVEKSARKIARKDGKT